MNKNGLVYILAVFFLGLVACEPGPKEPPPNPFDEIVYPEPPQMLEEPDSSSLVGLHKFIFSQSCAVPGCHDGHFEPDFRTVQSTYSSLVFQPVIKNTPGEEYTFRVLPFSLAESWLYNRVTTDDQVLGRMPLYDNPLTDGQLAALEKWINDGAPDMFGNVSTFPNTQPGFTGLAAFLDIQGLEYRVDTIRGDEPYLPFASLDNSDLTIWLGLSDDSTAVEDLQMTKLFFSDHYDDFGSAMEVNATYVPAGKVVPDYFGPGQPAQFYWKVEINTAMVPRGIIEPGVPEISFFRLSTEDGDHSEAFVFPQEKHPLEFKLYMSFFIVQ